MLLFSIVKSFGSLRGRPTGIFKNYLPKAKLILLNNWGLLNNID